MPHIIDVWDHQTFDSALIDDLRDNADLIRNYISTEREVSAEYEASDHAMRPRQNPYAQTFRGYMDYRLTPLMAERIIRAWHYSRMTDAEVARMRQAGVQPQNLVRIRARLDAMVGDGTLNQATADALYAESPFHNDPFQGRTDKFWMTSHPAPIDDLGFREILGLWGGESVAFYHIEGRPLRQALSAMGRCRILEVAVPIAVTNHASSAADSVMSGFATSLSLHYDHSVFDLYAKTDLPPYSILAIHSEGEADFRRMAQGYPLHFKPRR